MRFFSIAHAKLHTYHSPHSINYLKKNLFFAKIRKKNYFWDTFSETLSTRIPRKNAIKSYLMKKIYFSLLAASMALAASAVPAKRGVHNMPQPDGTYLPVLLVGDEHRHIYLTPDSLPITSGTDGFMEYARLDAGGCFLEATGVRATADAALRTPAERALIASIDARATRHAILSPSRKASPRRAIAQSGLGLFADNAFPKKGDVKALVILVEYSDVQFTTPNPAQYFSDMLMKEGFDEYGGTGSARDYFVENSMGQFRPEFDCYGPVTLPQKRSYYGGNNSWDEDKAPEDMIIHAVKILDPDVDFSQYDTDGDGWVDNVYVFYAGLGEASGGSADTVWPHSYNIYYGAGKNCTADGVRFDYYACSNEWEGSRPDGIGTFVHEFSHVMGLPDLYSTETQSTVTPDSYSVLDYGPYNNNGRTPPAYSAFERNALGWNEPVVLDGPASVSLEHILDSNTSYLIPTEKDTEFFLLENRQQTGWDEFIPGHGMLVWHIDYEPSLWRENSVNNTRSHQYVDIVEACGSANSNSTTTMRGYPFPGSRSKTSFTSATTPALKSWAGNAIDMPITNIKETSGVITFDAAGGASGITDITSTDSGVFAVAGLSIVYTGTPGAAVRVHDTSGRLVAATAADASGRATVTLPAGLYIATAGSGAAKLALR